MIHVHAVSAFTDNYIWLVQAAHSQRVLIIDPGCAEPVFAALTQYHLQPSAILITHHHADHVGGIGDILDKYTIPVYGPAAEPIPAMTHPLAASETLHIDTDFPAIHVWQTPGHTAGHLSYLIDNNLFCGDTLFAGGCGRLLGGTAMQLHNSLQKLSQLADETRVYCAHEYTEANLRFALAVDVDNSALQQRIETVKQRRQQQQATVPSLMRDEKQTNPFLRCDQPAIKKAVEQQFNRPLNDALAVFTALRQWKDHF